MMEQQEEIIKQLQEKNKELEEEIIQLKNKLKIYTAPIRNKKYYKNHKEEIIQQNKEYKSTLSIEKKKEYAKKAYLKKKEKEKNKIFIDEII